MPRPAEALDLDDQFDPDQIKIIDGIIAQIEGGHLYGESIRRTMTDYGIPEEALHPHLTQLALKQLEDRRPNPAWIKSLLDHFHVPLTRDIQTAAAKAVIQIAKRGDINQARAATDSFDTEIPTSYFTNNEGDVIGYLEDLVAMGKFDDARFYAGVLGIPKRFIIEAGKKTIATLVGYSTATHKQKTRSIEKTASCCGLTIQDVREAVENGFIWLIRDGKIKEARLWQKDYRISERQFREETRKAVNLNLNKYQTVSGVADRATEIQKAAPVKITPALRTKARRVLLSELHGHRFATAVSLKEEFKIPVDDEIKEAATESIGLKLAEIEKRSDTNEETLPILTKAVEIFELPIAEVKAKILATATKWLRETRIPPKFIKKLLQAFDIREEYSQVLAVNIIRSRGIQEQRDTEIITVFGIGQEAIIQEFISEELKDRLTKVDTYGAIDLIEKLSLKLTEKEKARGRKIVLEKLSEGKGNKDLLAKAAELFELDPNDQRIVTATSQGVVTALRMEHSSSIAALLDTGAVDINRGTVRKAALNAIRRERKHGDFQTARDLMKRFRIDRSKVLKPAA